MAKSYKLTEQQFIFLMSKALRERNNNVLAINKLVENGNNYEGLVDFYQKEIDETNTFFDEINAKHKTNF